MLVFDSLAVHLDTLQAHNERLIVLESATDTLYYVDFNNDTIPVIKGDTVVTLRFDTVTMTGVGTPEDPIGVDTTFMPTLTQMRSEFSDSIVGIRDSLTLAFDSIAEVRSDVNVNTAKVTNATHTGEVTGATSLTIADNVVAYSNVSDSLKGSATDDDLDWDFAASGIYVASKAVNDTITFSNLQVNKTLKAKLTISSSAVITWPASVKILNGSATLGDGTFYIYMDCWASDEVIVSITKEQ